VEVEEVVVAVVFAAVVVVVAVAPSFPGVSPLFPDVVPGVSLLSPGASLSVLAASARAYPPWYQPFFASSSSELQPLGQLRLVEAVVEDPSLLVVVGVVYISTDCVDWEVDQFHHPSWY
jgi:quinol-cytochrome oxidoreductase complex cytochrome b subunit